MKTINLSHFVRFVQSCFASLFGQVSWSSPPWLAHIRRSVAAKPRRFLLLGSLFAILAVLVGYGYQWYTHLPRPVLITANISAPPITPLEKVLVPAPLTIDFGIQQREFTPKSVAPLKMIGKEVPEGISLSPAMPGQWIWNSDNRLTFIPKEDWPAGQTYQINFAQKVFTSGTKMESLHFSFATEAFTPTISDFKFYQDPVNPKLRAAVATVNFNFPVDSVDLENKTTLLLEALKDGKQNLKAQHFKFTINYDEHKRTAYLRSEPLPLPDVPRYLRLTLDSGVKPKTGQASETAVTKDVLIPDAASYFKVSQSVLTLVRNDQGRSEQVLNLETTLGVTESELKKSLQVYLLPQDLPATRLIPAQKNYSWTNPGEVTPEILKLSTLVPLQAIPADRDYATLHSYKMSLPPKRAIYLQLNHGVNSFGDYRLASDFATILKVPQYPKEISFLHTGALLALSGEKKLSVFSRGVPALKFQIARVLPDHINQLVTQTEGDFTNPYFTNYNFTEADISEIFSEIQTFNSPDLAKGNYSAIDLGKYIAQNKGLFLLKIQGWDPQTKSVMKVSSSRLILATDMGLILKDKLDQSHDVYVQSITQGTPVANASVSILGKNGLPILTRVTDAGGFAHFPTLKDFVNEREPVVYVATVGNDVSFIPYRHYDRELNYSRFDVGGVYTSSDLQTLSAYLFSDRGIYRPGDTAHLGMIVKQAYAEPQPAGLPLEATITDPRGATVLDQKLTLDANGFFAVNFPTQAVSPTGEYVINLFIVKDNHPSSLLGSTTIQVAEFQPDRMRISAHLSTERQHGWVSPIDLKTKVQLSNLYGAPASDRRISAKMLLAPKQIHFSEYPHYTFVDPLFDPAKPAKVLTESLSETHTDAKGQATLDLNLERFDKATYELTVFVEGFEAEGGRSVNAQANTLVSPLAYFVGYKADGDLNFIKPNSLRQLHFIAVDPQLKQLGLTNLKIEVSALHPVSTLVKNPDGTYRYQSLIQTTVVSSKPFAVSPQGSDYALPTASVGDFLVKILDQNNTELSKFKYTVAGASQIPIAKNSELSVKLNKSEYQAGEDIELQISAPYTGSGLITIERDKVYATQSFKTDMTRSVQKIKIPKDFQGNGYINVAFVRDWNSPEIFISPLSVRVVPFTVSHRNHAIQVDLNTPAIAHPGEPYSIKYKSDKPGKIVVFAVDEGILQVAGYKTPDPLGYFFQKYALEVVTQQTMDLILPKFIQERELSAVGGDGAAMMMRSHLNPFKRKSDLPIVFWSGLVDTDSTVRELTYTIPDYFNGTLRVMAVAVSTDAVGSAEKTALIRGDFVIQPNVPTFVAPGDEFDVTASVANNLQGSGPKAAVTVTLNVAPQLEIVGDSHQVIAIPEGQEKSVKFKVRAKTVLGNAPILWQAKLADKSSKISTNLSVRPASGFFTTIQSGMADRSKSIKVDRDLSPEFRNVVAAASTSPLILLNGLQRYLDDFPYGCTEQLVSKVFPLLATQKSELGKKKIDDLIQLLGQRQMSSGAFAYWPNVADSASTPFASVYAMHFLTDAREAGMQVPLEWVQRGIAYLKELAAQTPENLDQARLQAYAIYILTRNEIVTTNYITHLQLYLDQDAKHAWQRDIISAYLAATYQLLKSENDANRIIKYYQPANPETIDTNDFYNSSIGDAEYLYLLARHFPDRLAKSGNDLVIPLVNAMNTDEISTILSSYTSIALSAYAKSEKPDLKISLSETLRDGKEKTFPATEKIDVDAAAQKVNFTTQDKQTYFYQLTQAGFDRLVPKHVQKNNLEVDREYRDAKGNVITSTTLGTEIEVHIQIRALKNNYFNNVAIIDLLPGGFEVVRDSVKSGGLMDYADIREDRVIFIGGVSSESKEIVYRIKATNNGQFTIPPISAVSLYHPTVNARSAASTTLFSVGLQP